MFSVVFPLHRVNESVIKGHSRFFCLYKLTVIKCTQLYLIQIQQ